MKNLYECMINKYNINPSLSVLSKNLVASYDFAIPVEVGESGCKLESAHG